MCAVGGKGAVHDGHAHLSGMGVRLAGEDHLSQLQLGQKNDHLFGSLQRTLKERCKLPGLASLQAGGILHHSHSLTKGLASLLLSNARTGTSKHGR